MNQVINESLTESVVDVLEKTAYLFPMVIEQEMPNDIDNANDICIGIQFEGPVSGKILLCIPKLLTIEIAANMLGIGEEEDGVEEKSIDATKEVLNIICGNLLPKIYGTEAVFQLKSPYIFSEIEKEIEGENTEIEKVKYDIEDNIVKVIFIENK